MLHAVLLRPLPYPEPDRLAAIWTRDLPPTGFDIPQFSLSGPEALDYREVSEVFRSLPRPLQSPGTTFPLDRHRGSHSRQSSEALSCNFWDAILATACR